MTQLITCYLECKKVIEMKIKMMKIIALSIFLSACNFGGAPEESVVLYNSEKNEIFISLLKEKKVDYRIGEGGVIFYPADQKAIAIEAFEQATGKKILDLGPPQ